MPQGIQGNVKRIIYASEVNTRVERPVLLQDVPVVSILITFILILKIKHCVGV